MVEDLHNINCQGPQIKAFIFPQHTHLLAQPSCFYFWAPLFTSFHSYSRPSTDTADGHHHLMVQCVPWLWERAQPSPWLMRPAYTIWPPQVSPAFSCIMLHLSTCVLSFLPMELQFLTTRSWFHSAWSHLLITKYSKSFSHFPPHLRLGEALWPVLLSGLWVDMMTSRRVRSQCAIFQLSLPELPWGRPYVDMAEPQVGVTWLLSQHMENSCLWRAAWLCSHWDSWQLCYCKTI